MSLREASKLHFQVKSVVDMSVYRSLGCEVIKVLCCHFVAFCSEKSRKHCHDAESRKIRLLSCEGPGHQLQTSPTITNTNPI